MAEFAGWEMPLYYHTGAIEEHHLVRRAAGVFDISHMGQLEIRGTKSMDALEQLLSARLSKLEPGMSTYSLLCRDDGTTLDDLFVYRTGDEDFLLVANAANRERDYHWITQRIDRTKARVDDVSDDLAMLALQGPQAVRLCDELTEGAAGRLERFAWARMDVDGTECFVSRTGYTGEDGVEILIAGFYAEALWNRLFEVAAEKQVELGPVGLAARDSLRFEAGLPLYGHELSDETTPVEARLTWACDLTKAFVGRDAIAERKQAGTAERLATFKMEERGMPRPGYDVVDSDGEQVGRVVSGMYAPTVDAYCGNAYLARDMSKPDTEISISIRGRQKGARVVRRPLYKPAYSTRT